MTDILQNYLGGRWIAGVNGGVSLRDPIRGTDLVRVDATGLDLKAGFAFSRREGGGALRSLTYRQRGEMLGAIAKLLQGRRDAYYEIALANSGTVKNDSAVDIDGAIYTISTYAKLAQTLDDRRFLFDGDAAALAKEAAFQSRHVLVPTRGLALFINAFNFPSWGLWEKAAPALLSGVPVVVKPATSTAWLAQVMVRDVVEARILPAGALSIVCGSSAGLLDALEPFDVVSFTGSAETAGVIRSHPAIAQRSVRANVEADSVNSAILAEGEAPGEGAFDLLVKEVVREMTVKSGQKCTAIRRILVPCKHYDAVAEAICARLGKVTVGDPRNTTVRMGALVNRAQYASVREGLARLREEAKVLHDGASHALVDADPAVACCLGPTLLGIPDPDRSALVHDIEVFGPVATLMPYRDAAHALDLARRGQGSLVASLFGSDAAMLSRLSLELADSHGRVHVVSPDVADVQTGHGNVMPQSLHGGPGRAGGGEELGGARALNFYHRRAAIQASKAVVEVLGN
ncbi:3,4-dehydroadipyl-CoA semialdehyde dehydrogenase [Bradyrhizobium sp. KB893862 SZCCT0404]|uniref:3,4-dehydroadipyl-CoA semialdehyde dehydrogenase n=1 Tax=Bradyrhizobium sp. KB893862 SZCCT0404 TaxID=2807672 RepID=UPI001BA92880|nr:3,4-dehydroadipyl-CoA semialdehyde dehydrogenase [Bradyrhizobium sp. KB893862 SZCCT0404]MBR1177023.1 3,4-dehydroadipyl-CoA semialdehyde dehydrogenase [Bradyrhizobium sp. KB893862 SZCCT0404]